MLGYSASAILVLLAVIAISSLIAASMDSEVKPKDDEEE